MRIEGHTLFEGACHNSDGSTNEIWFLGRNEENRNISLSFDIDLSISDDAVVTK